MAFAKANGIQLEAFEVMKIASEAEREYIGLNNGLLDQACIALGKKDHLLMLDCESNEYRLIPKNPSMPDFELGIFFSGLTRSLMSSDYNLRVAEKPEVPKTRWAVPPFYIYLKKDLDLVRHSVENGCGKDVPGNLAHYMVEHTIMHAWPMSARRFDIGSLDTYHQAVVKFGK